MHCLPGISISIICFQANFTTGKCSFWLWCSSLAPPASAFIWPQIWFWTLVWYCALWCILLILWINAHKDHGQVQVEKQGGRE